MCVRAIPFLFTNVRRLLLWIVMLFFLGTVMMTLMKIDGWLDI